MSLSFEKAVKRQEKLRMALDGPPGSGKTYTALILAQALAEHEEGRVAVIDSERSSARKYADLFDFDHLELPNFEPETYCEAIRAGSDHAVVVVDSLSHAWEGVLGRKDAVSARSNSGNSFDAWRQVTPLHNELVDTLLRAPTHVIATLRTKTEYVVEQNDQGKQVPRKIGLRPVQRDGTEYEFDVVGDMDQENTLVVSKTRCPDLAGQVVRRPDASLAETLWAWLDDGAEPLAGHGALDEIAERGKALPEGLLDEFRAWRDEEGLSFKRGLLASDAERALDKLAELEGRAELEEAGA